MTQSHTDRACSLLGHMTLAEKIAQLSSVWLTIEDDGSFGFRGSSGTSAGERPDEARALLRQGIGGLTRPLGTHPIRPREAVRSLNAIQRIILTESRLAIPALAHEECLAGVMAAGTTLFPAGINYGATWDPGLIERVGRAIGSELLSIGSRQGLAPVLDVSRDVRWGRTEETLGEDPYLVGTLATSYVRGLQGPEHRVLATLKHYVGHSFSEGGRNHAPVRIGERELNDVFMLPFEMAVKLAGAGSVMPAYHDIDGEPTSASVRLISEVLRRRWGFEGLVVSDYEAVSLLRDHHKVARDDAEASSLAIKAGIDMELPSFSCFREGIERAIARGLLDIADVDAAVGRVIAMKSRLGLFEHPYADEDAIRLNTDEHRAIAAEAAAKSAVLLKNDGILPLADSSLASLRVSLIGPLADEPYAMYGGYSFPIHVANGMQLPEQLSAGEGKTLRSALAERLPQLHYARGCDILLERPSGTPVFPSDAGVGNAPQREIESRDESGIAAAVAVASQSDLAVVVVGDIAGLFLSGTVGEGSDVSSFELPGVQQKLLDAVLQTGKPVIVVLISGRPYHLGSAFRRARALLAAWLPGQEGGEVIADILLGRREPGGRLPLSIPKSAGAMPYFYNYKLKAPGTPVQRDFGASFPFGHGLSYTSFTYGKLTLAQAEVAVDGEIEASVTVMNTGTRRGEEVVQLYVRDLYSSLVRPIQELKGFARISLEPGESRTVRFSLPTDLLAFSVDLTTRIVEPGEFDIMVGSSAGAIHSRATVTVNGQPRTLPEQWRMETRVEVG